LGRTPAKKANQGPASEGDLNLPALLGFEPVVIKHPPVMSPRFDVAEWARRLAAGAKEFVKRIPGHEPSHEPTPQEMAEDLLTRVAFREKLAHIFGTEDPEERKARLELLLGEITSGVLGLAGVPRRPGRKYGNYDLQISRLREEQQLTFGQIATRLGMDPTKGAKAVERAYHRTRKKREEFHRTFLRMKDNCEGIGIIFEEEPHAGPDFPII
jgi:hypothetical protein